MILSIFIFLFMISLVFLVIGWTWHADAFKYVAFTLMFLLGMIMLTNNLQYEVQTKVILNGTTYNIVPVYANLNEHTSSFLITITAAVGFIFTLVDRRKERESDYDAE